MHTGMPHDPKALADRLCADESALVTSLDFGPYVTQGCGKGPSLIIGDASEIDLFSPASDHGLEHRMGLLADPGDTVLVRRRDADYEAYLDSHLLGGKVTFLEVAPSRMNSVARIARETPDIVSRLAAIADRHGGLTITAYLTTGHVWRLAQAIGQLSQCRVHVAGPSPRTTRRVNDKLWFSDLARAVLGQDATPPTMSAYGPAATAGVVSYLARRADQVVVKVPDSAGSAGNITLEGAFIRALPLAGLRSFLLDRLRAVGWTDSYPVLVGVWEADVACSPSAQLWIPLAGEGDPICDGVFEQTVMGSEGRFVGATRSTLPAALQSQVKDQALRMATTLQRIGYFGQCSFDAVIQRRGSGPDVIHWIECNGRWGGVSIPQTALAKHIGPLPDGFVIVQERMEGRHLSTSDLIRRLNGLLWTRGGSGLILTAPPAAPSGVLLSACALAEDQDAADALVQAAIGRL